MTKNNFCDYKKIYSTWKKYRRVLLRAFAIALAKSYVRMRTRFDKKKALSLAKYVACILVLVIGTIFLSKGIQKGLEKRAYERNLDQFTKQAEIEKSEVASSEALEYEEAGETVQNVEEINTAETNTEYDNSDWEAALNKLEHDADDIFWYGQFSVDLNALKEINADIVGWLYFEAEDISYPILYSGDDTTYLRTTYLKEPATMGSIFIEGQNSPDFSDRHTLVYGHNMRDLTMFGQLKYYKEDADYYSNHQYFQIIILDEENGDIIKQRYHIFSCREASVSDDVYYIYDSNYEKIATFAENVLMEGNYLHAEEDFPILDSDYVVTLSTCSSDSDRFVVSAVRDSSCRISYRK